MADIDSANLNGKSNVSFFVRLPLTQGRHNPTCGYPVIFIFSGVSKDLGIPFNGFGVAMVGVSITDCDYGRGSVVLD